MIKKIITTITLIFIGGVSFCQTLNTTKLDSLFQTIDTNNKFMGSVSIFQKGKEVYKRNVGFSIISEKEKIKNSADTKYQIGSITKMFTATIIYQLIDEGKLKLDTKLSVYFPEIKNANLISIKSLLGHKSGLFDFVNDIEDEKYLTEKRDKKELLNSIIKGKPNFKPNVKFLYSNSGYLLLSYIIEKITAKKYKDVVQERICNKIKLQNTYSCTSTDVDKNIAKPYSFNGKWNEIKDFYFDNVQGVGDIISTPSDLILFNEALLRGKLISTKSLGIMKSFSGEQFCFGIMQIPFDDKTAYGHGGDTYGTHSIISTFEKENLSIACVDNGAVMELNEIIYALSKICFNKEYTIPTYNNVALKTEDLDSYTGIYSCPKFPLKITITKDNVVLYSQATGQNKLQMDAVSKTKFEYKLAGVLLEFILEKNEMVLTQAGKTFIFTKK